MIQKLRLKFVAVCMLLVTAVLGVVFASMYTSAERNIEHISRQLLQRVISEEGTPSPGNDTRGSGPDFGSGKVQLPYFTVEIWGSGTVYVTGGTYSNLEDTDELTAIITECIKQSAWEGTISDYDLRYLRQDNGLFTQIASPKCTLSVNYTDESGAAAGFALTVANKTADGSSYYVRLNNDTTIYAVKTDALAKLLQVAASGLTK